MPFLDLPEDWTCTITIKPDSIVYRFGNDKDEEEFVRITIDLFNESGVLKANIVHSGVELGPELELVIIGANENMPPMSPAEIFYYVMKKYANFYHENDDHGYENLALSCLSDMFIRAQVMEHLIAGERPPMTMEKD